MITSHERLVGYGTNGSEKFHGLADPTSCSKQSESDFVYDAYV